MRKVYAVGLAGLVLIVAACVPTKPPPPPPPTNTDVLLVGDSVGFGVGCVVLGHNADDPMHPPSSCPPEPDFSSLNGYLGACSVSQGWILLYSRSAIEGNCNNGGAGTDYSQIWPNAVNAVDPELVVIVTGGWEIVDRWDDPFPASLNCSTIGPAENPPGVGTFQCPEVDRQWASTDANQATAAVENYVTNMTTAITQMRNTASNPKVLILNSPYVAPTQPSSGVWWEAYGPGEPAGWNAPNQATDFVGSKTKIDALNAAVADMVAGINLPGEVEMFDFHAEFTVEGQYSDFVCEWPHNQEPLTACDEPGEPAQILARAPDHGHFTGDGNEILAHDLLTKVREMLGLPQQP